jgi:hypothetical protein
MPGVMHAGQTRHTWNVLLYLPIGKGHRTVYVVLNGGRPMNEALNMGYIKAVLLLSVLGAYAAPEMSSRMAFDPYALTPITN